MGLASYADNVRLAIISTSKGINTLKLYKHVTKNASLTNKTLRRETPLYQEQHHTSQEKEQVTTTDRCRDHYRSVIATYSGHGIDQ